MKWAEIKKTTGVLLSIYFRSDGNCFMSVTMACDDTKKETCPNVQPQINHCLQVISK